MLNAANPIKNKLFYRKGITVLAVLRIRAARQTVEREEMKERLDTEVVKLFRNELADVEAVSADSQNIIISLSTINFEQRLGDYLQRIYRLVDQYLPHRLEHLAIMLKDLSGQYEHVFKIWAPVGAGLTANGTT